MTGSEMEGIGATSRSSRGVNVRDEGDVDYTRVGTSAELPEGEIRAYDLPQGRVAVANVGPEIRAFGDDCPEAGCSLADGELADEDTVVCASDGSAFDLRTGEPVTGPAEDAIAVYPARVREGWLEVALG
jgi:3-phenylpropionate/trans-cinnamate dioxygenase ferredoxin subunit